MRTSRLKIQLPKKALPTIHKLRQKAISANYASRKFNIPTVKLTLAVVQRVYENNIKKYGTLTCYLCNKPITFGDDNLEHLLPISRGGTHIYSNLSVAHKDCNHKKHHKTPNEYRNYKPRTYIYVFMPHAWRRKNVHLF